jgi:hypothetical protein
MIRWTAALLFLTGVAAAPAPAGIPFELTTLGGQRHSGEIVRLSAEQAVVKSSKSEVTVPLAEVLDLRALRTKPIAAVDSHRTDLTLADGTRLFWTTLRAEGQQVAAESSLVGKFVVPLRSVSSIRLQLLDPAIADAWKDLCGRELTQDMLVIRKGNVLDHLDGTAGAISDKTIRFVIDREEVAVKREKVFGLIYARRNADLGKPICEVTASGGDFIKAQFSNWTGGKLVAGLLGGATITIPGEEIASIDFSLGKVRYLSQLEPREVKYTPFFDQVWKYYKDRPRDGGMLRLGNKEYARGLWIHSRTLLKYRLNGEYRRFQAVMGIDQAVAPHGDVHVVINGDGKTLHDAEVRGTDAPQTLDLDVAGVRDLEIFVDFGGGLDIADHLDLADAKVIK